MHQQFQFFVLFAVAENIPSTGRGLSLKPHPRLFSQNQGAGQIVVFGRLGVKSIMAAHDTSGAIKIFIQRDFSLGTAVRFSTEMPRELMGKVS